MLTHALPDTPVKNTALQKNGKDDDDTTHVDPVKDTITCGGPNAKPNGENEGGEGKEEEEEEIDKKQGKKGSKKKSAAATPKASPNRTHLNISCPGSKNIRSN